MCTDKRHARAFSLNVHSERATIVLDKVKRTEEKIVFRDSF